MVTATFRFHDDLIGFLPRERRGKEIVCACAQGATTKHMIEALGVPHTEVHAIRVNGTDATLCQLLRDGDRVEVDAASLARSSVDVAATALEQEDPSFIADAHLGGLARWLRMAGFDTLYDNAFGDSEIETLAGRTRRIVLTRDRELLKRRGIERGCYVHSLTPSEQAMELSIRLGLAKRLKPFTLCLQCNAPLVTVEKHRVIDRLPPSVRALQHEFSLCEVCDRVYWKGSHWRRMNTRLEASFR